MNKLRNEVDNFMKKKNLGDSVLEDFIKLRGQSK